MDRLTALDLSMLWPDEFGWPQDIGGLAILDGSRLLDAGGRLRIGHVREAIDARLHLVPRFRQLVYFPSRGLGWPLWVDAPRFDLADHVRVFPVPAPGDEAQLLQIVEQLRRRQLDRSRPLWQMWFLPGLPDRRVGFLLKVHHTIADGVAGVATLGALTDTIPDPPVSPAPAWTPAPEPSARELLEDNLRGRLDGFGRAASACAHPVATMGHVRAAWPALRETFAEGWAPRSSLNRPIGSDRRLAVVRSRLDVVRRVAHMHDATINDVLMAAIAGGFRDLLRSRGERVDGLVLRAYVPVSLHREQPGQAHGNLDGMMVVPLPVGVPDPTERVRLVAAETTTRKKRHRPAGGTLFRNGLVQRAFLRVLARQRWANAYVANVPGPRVPLYLAGAPLLELFPLVPLTGNLTLGVGALSYAGQFNLTAVADRDTCPDVRVFADGVRAALQSLARSGIMESTRV
jgi:diacylglycerol O-acyltransferase / wax synthase